MMEINSFEFTHVRGETTTQVMLDLTTTADRGLCADVFPYFEIEILKGSQASQSDRVQYNFMLTNEMAHIFKTAIVNAVAQVNGQLN